MSRFLSDEGLNYFTQRIVELIGQKTQINIVGAIDADSTNQQLPGAKAVYDLLHEALKNIVNLKMEVVDTLPTEGESNIIYLVKADEDTYTQNIYAGDNWYDLGTTDLDLSDQWTFKNLEDMSNAEIQNIIDNALGI
jgi:hypothetical protein